MAERSDSPGTIQLVDPVGFAAVKALVKAGKLQSIEGLTAGFLSNSQPYALNLLEAVAGALKEKYGLAGWVVRTKTSPSHPPPPEVMEELAQRTDFLIAGVGI